MNWNFKNVIRYLRELSIIIAGIAITFMASDWIGNRKEKKELARSLEAVKIELQENLIAIKEHEKYYEEAASLASYLNSTRQENFSQDSIQKLDIQQGYDVSTRIITVIYKTSAFEMLKTSGNMRLIKDANLYRSILESYTNMEMVKQQSDKYMERKLEILMDAYTRNKISGFDIFDTRFSDVVNFLGIITLTHQNFNKCVQQIEETLELF